VASVAVPVGVWALAVQGKEKVAAKEAAADEAVVVARVKEEVEVPAKGKAADRISDDFQMCVPLDDVVLELKDTSTLKDCFCKPRLKGNSTTVPHVSSAWTI